MAQLEINLNTWQKKVWKVLDKFRFIVISAGRQSGKTFFCVFLIALRALQNEGSINWWVAPTYTPSKMAFRRLITFCEKYKIPYKSNKSELRVEIGSSVIEFKSADREEGLRGETVDFMVTDETGLLKRDAWQYALRGTITATGAQVILIGTPKGKNLFYEEYCKGQDPEEEDYISFQIESRESKFFPLSEWKAVEKLPSRIFQQEYQAMFIDDGGEVFRNISECVRGDFEEPHQKKAYFAGVDLAKSFDYTVICVIDEEGHLVAYDRFNDIAWSVQRQRIIDLCGKYNAYTLIDSTGLGDPILEDLQDYIRAEGYKFSNTTKRQLIESLMVSIERVEVSFPEIPELINELNIFTFDQTAQGNIRYSAPQGLHDDIVISLSLANWAWGGSRMDVEIVSTEGRDQYDW